MTAEVSLQTIRAAQRSISGTAMWTPLVRSDALSARTGGDVFLKLETLQPTGSFKVRGITNKVSMLTEDERKAGLIAISSGNHGRALAWIARRMGIAATIALYRNVPANKIDAIKKLGGQVELCGETYEEAEKAARQLADDRGMIWCDPFDDSDVIAGQGVIGLEIVEDLPAVDLVIVPLSGGGLFSGTATAVKAISPEAKLIGVANRHGNGMLASLEAGQPVPIEEHPSLADCMAGTISADNRHTFAITRRLIDEAVLIEEKDVAPALVHGFMHEGLIMEGGASLPIATLLTGAVAGLEGKTIVLIITGRNIDPHKFLDAVALFHESI